MGLTREQTAVFTSSDAELQRAYEWARNSAFSFVHDGGDPVGEWYEAALPGHDAFCIRNVAHQSTGAQILGLSAHTKNMVLAFAANMTEKRDWCPYWEINASGEPVSATNHDDGDFFFSLPANHDMLQACMKMYRWTGDDDYVKNEKLKEFYTRTVDEFSSIWNLMPEKAMTRQGICGVGESGKLFDSWRGVPSYSENFPDITVGVDLVASLYAGNKAYADYMALEGNRERAAKAQSEARRFSEILDSEWWNEKNGSFMSHRKTDGSFGLGEGLPYVLWFEATGNADYLKRSIAELKKREWNEENLSHFPMIYFTYGCCEEGYETLMSLPVLSRSQLPEVAFGFVEGCISGAMGLRPDYVAQTIGTEYRLPNPDTQLGVENVPVFGGHITLQHSGHSESRITNNTAADVKWLASFAGDYDAIETDGRLIGLKKEKDIFGQTHTTAEIHLPSSATLTARPLPSQRRLAQDSKSFSKKYKTLFDFNGSV